MLKRFKQNKQKKISHEKKDIHIQHFDERKKERYMGFKNLKKQIICDVLLS